MIGPLLPIDLRSYADGGGKYPRTLYVSRYRKAQRKIYQGIRDEREGSQVLVVNALGVDYDLRAIRAALHEVVGV